MNALVNCGCTANGYADRSFIWTNNIRTHCLPYPKKLLLTDGETSDMITEYFIMPFAIEHYQELCFFYLTNFGKNTLLILSVPWLQAHNPSIYWSALKLTFTSDHCYNTCLPPNLPREIVIQAPSELTTSAISSPPPAHNRLAISHVELLRRYRPPSVEDCPNYLTSSPPVNIPKLHIPESLTLGQPHYRTHNPLFIKAAEGL
jgi:hypothetical protein